MDANQLFTLFLELLIVWLGVTVHEASHAWVALRCGDDTAAAQGHATLNPLPHLDFFGSVLFPSLLAALGANVFGWGRPAPLDTAKLRRPDRDDVYVVLAGVVGNFLLVVVAVVALVVAVRTFGADARQAALLTLVHRTEEASKLASFPVMFTLVRLATINGFLIAFNLLPLPPLDGGRLALIFLPKDWSERLARLSPYPRTFGILIASLILIPLFLIPFAGFLGFVINLS